MYRCITLKKLPGPSCGDPFCLLANLFLFYCSDFTVFIFLMLFGYIYSKTKLKASQGLHPVSKVTYSSCPLYYFTLMMWYFADLSWHHIVQCRPKSNFKLLPPCLAYLWFKHTAQYWLIWNFKILKIAQKF